MESGNLFRGSISALKRLTIGLVLIFTILLAGASPALSYEEDTHFLMTYVICRSVGFSEADALTVAAANQGMDDSKPTAATGGITEQWMWHAIPKSGRMKSRQISGRRDALFHDALNDPDPINRLVRLGIFFHFQQDAWAHRHHYRDDHIHPDDYTPLPPGVGHGPWGHQPDRIPYDPKAALLNLEHGVIYASDFLRRALKQEPNPFFKDYKFSGRGIDNNWKDPRQGKYFNQIDVSGVEADSPQLYLASLIRAQIDAYKLTWISMPAHLFRRTGRKAFLEDAANEIGPVLVRFKNNVGEINLKKDADKESRNYDQFTTVKLLSLRPGYSPGSKPWE
jgi:hypothetical protein